MKSKKFGPFTFKIDRPAGYVKEWPRPDGSVKRFTYPVDYGYWPKIKGEDGEGLDAFVGDDEKGHLESFQKLNPDGSLDETKFLLGVSDAEREKIYKLYGTEVHARRVYETFDDVQKALDTFKTKMHKSEKKLADFHAVKMAAVFGVGNTVTDSLREADSLWRRVAEKATEPIQYVHLSPGVAGAHNGTHIKLPIESENILEKYKGNILASPHTTERLLHEKAHTLAHEIGHGQWDKHPVGFVTQNSLIHGVGQTPLPHVLSVGAGLFGRTRTRRALGVLGGALSAAAPLLNEHVASKNGLKLLQQAGASPSSIADYLAGEKYNLSGHLRHTGINLGLGLASMGAREAYDWYKAKHNPEPDKKLADFHAVKLAKDVSPSDLSAQVGSQQYYLSRAKDFRERHPSLRAPDYYHDYGDKYVHRFAIEVSPKLTAQGRDWLGKATHGLQLAIENKRAKDPSAFDRLERDPDAFRRFAFDSHPRAYLNAGLKDLPLKDLVRIGLTPDVKDILTPSGMTQVARTAKGYVKHASNVFNALNWVPEPYQDRIQTPYQMLTSARNTPALTATQPNLRMLQVSRENSQY